MYNEFKNKHNIRFIHKRKYITSLIPISFNMEESYKDNLYSKKHNQIVILTLKHLEETNRKDLKFQNCLGKKLFENQSINKEFLLRPKTVIMIEHIHTKMLENGSKLIEIIARCVKSNIAKNIKTDMYLEISLEFDIINKNYDIVLNNNFR